jgi:hypothetical protein
LIVVADAKPVIVLVATRTCFRSIYTVVFAAIAVVVWSDVFEPAVPIPIVNVPADPAVLVIAILLTTVVVEAGTVYNTVLDVAAAVLARTLVVVGIFYSLS